MCCPEIQKLHSQGIRFIRIQHIDIIRRNIPVQKTAFMHSIHRCRQLKDHRDRLALRHGSLFLQIRFQADAIQILHHNIGCPVTLKAIVDMDDSRNRGKLCQMPGFINGLPDTVPKLCFLLAPVYSQRLLSRHPGRQIAGQIFLDRHPPLNQVIPANVGDSKAARAEHPAHNITLVQDISRRQIVGLARLCIRRIPAMRANIITVVILLHTAHA